VTRFISLQVAFSDPSKSCSFLAICVLLLGSGYSFSQAGNSNVNAAPVPHVAAQPSQLDPELSRMRALLDNGAVMQAEQAAHTYLEAHPNSADAHFLLGLILFKAVNAKESLAEYTKGSEYREPSPYDLEIVALDYVLLRDYMDADKWLSQSLAHNPKNPEGWYYLGRTKYNENRFEEAVRAFQECLKQDPKNIKAEDNLGLSYAGLGRSDEAMAAYQLAISWQADKAVKDSGPFLDLGSLLLDENRTSEAIPYLMQAKQISPDDSRTHEELGKAYERSGRLQEAQSELVEAVKMSPQDAALHFLLGRVYQKQKLMDKAKSEFERSAKLNQAQASKEQTR
jgi:Flp pilus assembly protein TadD